MENRVVHISEADLIGDVRAILQRVQMGAEIIIERDAQPIAVLSAANPIRRTVSECIALAKAHEEETGFAPTLDADFAADVKEIVQKRKPRDHTLGIDTRFVRGLSWGAPGSYRPPNPRKA